jgi:hypothetical protein
MPMFVEQTISYWHCLVYDIWSCRYHRFQDFDLVRYMNSSFDIWLAH